MITIQDLPVEILHKILIALCRIDSALNLKQSSTLFYNLVVGVPLLATARRTVNIHFTDTSRRGKRAED